MPVTKAGGSMAKKSTGTTRKTTTRSSRRSSGKANSGANRGDHSTIFSNISDFSSSKRGVLMDVVNNPAFKYVVGGIATAVLTKVVTSMSDRYPEISNFLRENLETIEDKLTEFKGTLGDTDNPSRYS
jgi:hypothetical protein